MAGKKIQLKDQLGRVIHLNSDATDGATLGKNLYGPDGKLLTAAQIINPPASNQNASATVWKLIREVPANIQKLAKLATSGFAVRQASGEWVTRTLQAGVGIDITNPDGDAGDPTVSLEDLPDSGVGAALVKITRDAQGRIPGTQAASTTDLAEGANLYYTDARADARIALQKGQPNGIADLDAGGKIPTARLPAIAITETFVVASQAAQLALTAQEGDVAVRTDQSKNYIRNAGTSGTMTDWTELLTPAAPVQSVNGKTGTVNLVPADIGAATAAQGAKADSAVQSVVAGTGISVNNTDPRNPVLSGLIPLSGLYSARPTAVVAGDGAIYLATDVQEAYVSNGSAWALMPGAGCLLASSERTTPISITTNPPGVDVPGLTFNVVVGERPLILSFGASLYLSGAAGDIGAMILNVDGVNVSQLLVPGLPTYTGFSRDVLITGKTPGSTVVVKIVAFATSASTLTIFGDPADKSFLYARNA